MTFTMRQIQKSDFYEIFDLAQDSLSKHNKLLKNLTLLYDKYDDKQEYWDVIIEIVKRFLVCESKDQTITNGLILIAKLCATIKEDKSSITFGDLASDSTMMKSDVHTLIGFMLNHLDATLPIIRYRICQFFYLLFQNLGKNDEVEANLYDEIYDKLVFCLMDKSSMVRSMAISATAPFQNPLDPDCPIIKDYLFLLKNDPLSTLRLKVLQNIIPCRYTKASLLERCRDPNSVVRKTAYTIIMEKIPIKYITIHQRIQLLTLIYNEDDANFRKTFSERLITTWVKQLDGNILQLLSLLDFELCPKLSAQVLTTFFESVLKNLHHSQGPNTNLEITHVLEQTILSCRNINNNTNNTTMVNGKNFHINHKDLNDDIDILMKYLVRDEKTNLLKLERIYHNDNYDLVYKIPSSNTTASNIENIDNNNKTLNQTNINSLMSCEKCFLSEALFYWNHLIQFMNTFLDKLDLGLLRNRYVEKILPSNAMSFIDFMEDYINYAIAKQHQRNALNNDEESCILARTKFNFILEQCLIHVQLIDMSEEAVRKRILASLKQVIPKLCIHAHTWLKDSTCADLIKTYVTFAHLKPQKQQKPILDNLKINNIGDNMYTVNSETKFSFDVKNNNHQLMPNHKNQNLCNGILQPVKISETSEKINNCALEDDEDPMFRNDVWKVSEAESDEDEDLFGSGFGGGSLNFSLLTRSVNHDKYMGDKSMMEQSCLNFNNANESFSATNCTLIANMSSKQRNNSHSNSKLIRNLLEIISDVLDPLLTNSQQDQIFHDTPHEQPLCNGGHPNDNYTTTNEDDVVSMEIANSKATAMLIETNPSMFRKALTICREILIVFTQIRGPIIINGKNDEKNGSISILLLENAKQEFEHLKPLLNDVILPGIQWKKSENKKSLSQNSNDNDECALTIRSIAFECLGFLCLLDREIANKNAPLLYQAFQLDLPPIQLLTARILFDLALIYGNNFTEINTNDINYTNSIFGLPIDIVLDCWLETFENVNYQNQTPSQQKDLSHLWHGLIWDFALRYELVKGICRLTLHTSVVNTQNVGLLESCPKLLELLIITAHFNNENVNLMTNFENGKIVTNIDDVNDHFSDKTQQYTSLAKKAEELSNYAKSMILSFMHLYALHTSINQYYVTKICCGLIAQIIHLNMVDDPCNKQRKSKDNTNITQHRQNGWCEINDLTFQSLLTALEFEECFTNIIEWTNQSNLLNGENQNALENNNTNVTDKPPSPHALIAQCISATLLDANNEIYQRDFSRSEIPSPDSLGDSPHFNQIENGPSLEKNQFDTHFNNNECCLEQIPFLLENKMEKILLRTLIKTLVDTQFNSVSDGIIIRELRNKWSLIDMNTITDKRHKKMMEKFLDQLYRL